MATHSGYIEFNINDESLLRSIVGKWFISTAKSDFPGYFVARFEAMPEEMLDELDKYWGQFDYVVDSG